MRDLAWAPAGEDWKVWYWYLIRESICQWYRLPCNWTHAWNTRNSGFQGVHCCQELQTIHRCCICSSWMFKWMFSSLGHGIPFTIWNHINIWEEEKIYWCINSHHHHQDWFSSALLNTTRVDCLLPSILSKVSSVWGLPVFITNTTMEKVELCSNWHPQIVETEKES